MSYYKPVNFLNPIS